MSLLLSLCASVSLWSKLLVEAFPIVNYGVEIHHKTIGAISNLPTKPLGDPIGVRSHFGAFLEAIASLEVTISLSNSVTQ